MNKEVATYAGAVFAIAFGLVLLYIPPTNIAGQAGTVGTALSFITGGLAALGITVTIPAVRNSAIREGYVQGHADGKSGVAPRFP